MVFSSLIFLYAFFPISLLFCWLFKQKKAQNIVLLISSLVFYAWGEPKYVLLLLIMSLVSWICALQIERGRKRSRKKGKGYVVIAALIDIALIGYFKYAGLIVSVFGEVPESIRNIALPIGISFYTFQLLTYVVDVYKEEAPAQRSYFNVLLYAALFHQCIAGPIVRYKTIDEELFGPEPRRPRLARGIRRFSVGLGKKVLLANACGVLADSLFPAADITILSGNTVLGAWTGLIAYALQIYLDFSAYSDMAIGMGLMMGLHYPENFDHPYISRSVTEFWRRWHMSLGTFFRDYVYIPLGGSRCAWPRMVFNTLVVWALTGLWHGASWNFVLWGLWFFVFLMIERAFLKKVLDRVPILSNLYLLAVVLLGWVIFRCEDLSVIGVMTKSLFGLNGNTLSDFVTVVTIKNNLFLLIVSLAACLPIWKRAALAMENACLKYRKNHKGLAALWQIISYCAFPILMLLFSTAGLVGLSYNPFLYFQF